MEKISIENSEWGVPHDDHECGPCTACCTWLGIEELKKYTGQKCKHLRSAVYTNKRCGIYLSRPEACSTYKCVWREGWGPKDIRPHESGILITAYPSDDGVKVNFTVTVFDLEKAKPHYNKVVTALATLDNTEEVRLIFYKEKNALLFKDGKIYACKLLPAKGYEELTFVAQDVPVGTYYTYQEK